MNVSEVIDTHLLAYGEPDATRRLELVRQVWSADGSLADPPFEASGHDGIAGLTDVVLQHYPAHAFRRTSAVDAHHETARYTWVLEDADGAAAVAGTDIATFAPDGRLRRIVGFFGDLPAMDA